MQALAARDTNVATPQRIHDYTAPLAGRRRTLTSQIYKQQLQHPPPAPSAGSRAPARAGGVPRHPQEDFLVRGLVLALFLRVPGKRRAAVCGPMPDGRRALWLAAWGALVHVHRAAFVPGPPMRLGAVPGLPLLSRSARWPPSANPLETPRGVASAAARAPDPGNDFGDSNGAGDMWYQDGLRFSCTMCGNCCSGRRGSVQFDEAEAEAMAAKLEVDLATFYAQFTRKKASELKEIKAGRHGWDCIMLDRVSQPGKALCRLYEARPRQCRTWPFWAEVVESPDTWADAGTQHMLLCGESFLQPCVRGRRCLRDANARTCVSLSSRQARFL